MQTHPKRQIIWSWYDKKVAVQESLMKDAQGFLYKYQFPLIDVIFLQILTPPAGDDWMVWSSALFFCSNTHAKVKMCFVYHLYL